MDEYFLRRGKKAAKRAMADLDSAEMYESTVKVPNLNFIRRFRTSDGKYVPGTSEKVANGIVSKLKESK